MENPLTVRDEETAFLGNRSQSPAGRGETIRSSALLTGWREDREGQTTCSAP
jgi:hypothetical protein